MRKFILLLLAAVIIISISLFYFGFIRNNKDINEIIGLVDDHLISKGNSKGEFNVAVEYHWENKLFGYNPYNINVFLTMNKM
ncbi:hypothetical protein [Paenibacillus tuaregi]|uniref:hypothetical protein n=1 Tax=Paenibacillus tuaregi TaxID=1816681 RepID=UPI0008393379|nr:hypothetical protein [Paenibacillus tuaregi]